MGGEPLSPIVIRGALQPAALLDAVERALAQQGLLDGDRWVDGPEFVPNRSPTWVAIQQAVLASPAMQAAREHLGAVLARALGRPVTPRCADVVRVFAPGTEETTPAHQDAHYFLETWPRLVAWVALTEPERGGLEVFTPAAPVDAVLPHIGQHEAGPYLERLPPGAWSRPTLRPGDAVVFDVLTIHRGTANSTDGPRMSVDLRFD